MGKAIRETDLYEPVKQLLEGQGYEVKGEVGSADVTGSGKLTQAAHRI